MKGVRRPIRAKVVVTMMANLILNHDEAVTKE